jgi:hypothetical protein
MVVPGTWVRGCRWWARLTETGGIATYFTGIDGRCGWRRCWLRGTAVVPAGALTADHWAATTWAIVFQPSDFTFNESATRNTTQPVPAGIWVCCYTGTRRLLIWPVPFPTGKRLLQFKLHCNCLTDTGWIAVAWFRNSCWTDLLSFSIFAAVKHASSSHTTPHTSEHWIQKNAGITWDISITVAFLSPSVQTNFLGLLSPGNMGHLSSLQKGLQLEHILYRPCIDSSLHVFLWFHFSN